MPDPTYSSTKATDPNLVTTWADAQEWIDRLHRRTCDDAARMNRIESRLRNLERPWWKRLLRIGAGHV